MQYMCLIYGNEITEANTSPEEMAKVMAAYNAFGKEAQERGLLVSGEALHATKMATTVRVRNGKLLTTDGPFAETKEQLGGYYVLNCKDLDEAIAMAAKIPGAAVGCVEVRPIVDFSQMG